MTERKIRVVVKKKSQCFTQNENLNDKENYVKSFNTLLPELEDVREEIFKILTEFLKDYYDEHKTCHDVDFVFFEPTSRIKSRKSFEEKIIRKNYVKSWKVKDKDYEKTILENLDDIIGFRINCYFKKDEPNIYFDVIDFLEENSLFKIKEYGTKSKRKIERNERENIEAFIETQSNGEPIYKIVLTYNSPNHSDRSYPFELQIKSLVHNLWGEVDHEIAYKAKQYDYNFEQKKVVTKAIFETLKASDTQLYNLYRTNYEEINLINSLFFLYSKDIVEKALNGKNPTFYYHKFFHLFDDGITIELIKKYVSLRMTNSNLYEKKVFVIDCKEEKLKNIFVKILEENNLYDFNRCNEIKEIASIIYKLDEPDNKFMNNIYSIIRLKISDISIRNDSPEDYVEEDDDNVAFMDSDSEIEKPSLEEIFKEDLKVSGKKDFYDVIKNRKDCNEYEKEILCRVFFNLFDI